MRHFAGGRFEVSSAGMHPVPLHPLAASAMAEIGIDISHHRSKSLKEFLRRRFDYVIAVCDAAREACPVFPGRCKKIHWSFKDPAKAEGTHEEKMAVFRRVREEIKESVVKFLAEAAL